MKCSLGVSNFLEELSSLSHSVVFLYFFALIAEEGFLLLFGTLHSDAYIFPFLLCFSLLFFSQLFAREYSTHGHHQIVNTEIRLITFFAAKDGETLHNQQKQDRELRAQIMNSLLPNSDLN